MGGPGKVSLQSTTKFRVIKKGSLATISSPFQVQLCGARLCQLCGAGRSSGAPQTASPWTRLHILHKHDLNLNKLYLTLEVKVW